MRSRGHVENEVRVVSESVACAFDLDDDGVAAVHVGAVALACDAGQFLWAISQDFRRRQMEGACKHIVRNRFRKAGRRWSIAGAAAPLAAGCCFENMRWPDFLDWRAGRAAAWPPDQN